MEPAAVRWHCNGAVVKRLSYILIIGGLILIGFWALARLDSEFNSAAALEEFTAATQTALQRPAAAGASPASLSDPADTTDTVDTTLWSQKRIDGFKRALGLHTDPAIAVLAIPRIGLEAPIFRGTDEVTLNRGIGWIEGTAEPGGAGNSGLAAHRDGFFRPLKDIAVNDVIELRTRSGARTFVVRDWAIVEKDSVDVLAPTSHRSLTLVTCYPFYYVGSAPKRFIVHADESVDSPSPNPPATPRPSAAQ
jgi:sortase A